MKKTYLLLIAACFSFIMANASAPDTTVSTLVNFHQGNGAGLATRTVVDTFELPYDVSMYSAINMHVQLNCPTGGCDPWDRFASISVWHENDWFEIGRYMTPYGKSCGWTIDVSDYRNMLTGTVIIKSFIDTWTNPGWLVNVDFTFIGGTPVNPYIKVENLWNDYNVVYGDSTQPINILPMTRDIDGAATAVKVKIINTGHGQGNTSTAAEFSQMTHHVLINGVSTFSQSLWRANCSSNPCSPQSGTWQYPRAGWCPGADVIPNEYDITSYVTPGQSVTVGYELQSYYNICSPHNPTCVATGNCPDCNYNYNGHTEPHYKIAGQLISYLSTPTGIKDAAKSSFSIVPNPSSGIFTVRLYDSKSSGMIDVFSSLGKLIFSEKIVDANQKIDLSEFAKGIYYVKFTSGKSVSTQKLLIN